MRKFSSLPIPFYEMCYIHCLLACLCLTSEYFNGVFFNYFGVGISLVGLFMQTHVFILAVVMVLTGVGRGKRKAKIVPVLQIDQLTLIFIILTEFYPVCTK